MLTTKMRLHDAVCLQLLDAAQIRAFLDRVDASNLWNPIEGDATLLEMACSGLRERFHCVSCDSWTLLLSDASCSASEAVTASSTCCCAIIWPTAPRAELAQTRGA